MDKLSVSLENCYGIKSFKHVFEFKFMYRNKPRQRAYAIYAPNGSMKTSFAKTFTDLSKGEKPREERYGRSSNWLIKADEVEISKEKIYVLKAGSDFQADNTAVTNVLVNSAEKAKYDALVVDLEKQKSKLISVLQKQSSMKKGALEQTLLSDMNLKGFPECIEQLLSRENINNLESFQYDTIFAPQVLPILESKEFIAKATEFNDRYQELFTKTGTIYERGVFMQIAS